MFVWACGIPLGGRLLTNVSHSGRISQWLGPLFQRSLAFTCDSNVKKSLGINSPKRKKGSASAEVSPIANRNQHPIGYQLERDKPSGVKTNYSIIFTKI